MTESTKVVSVKALTLVGLAAVFVAGAAWGWKALAEQRRLEPIQDGIAAIKEERYGDALKALEPLASSGQPEAARLMGQLYAFGLGVRKDAAVARTWFRRAECSCPNPGRHEYDTALDFAQGFAGQKDSVAATEWLRFAAEAGNTEARQLLDDPSKASSKGFAAPPSS